MLRRVRYFNYILNLVTKVVLKEDNNNKNNEGSDDKFNKKVILFKRGVVFKKLYNLVKFIKVIL